MVDVIPYLNEIFFTGCWVYCTFGCSCISQAGVNKSRKTCAQLYDGHSAHKEGKLLEGCNSKGILPMAKWPNLPGSMAKLPGL